MTHFSIALSRRLRELGINHGGECVACKGEGDWGSKTVHENVYNFSGLLLLMPEVGEKMGWNGVYGGYMETYDEPVETYYSLNLTRAFLSGIPDGTSYEKAEALFMEITKKYEKDY